MLQSKKNSKNNMELEISSQTINPKKSLFDDSYHNLQFEKELKKATGNDLKDKDVSDMIRTQKDFEHFGRCRCGPRVLGKIWKFRVLVFNVIFCMVGLLTSYYLISDEEFSNRVWFYTIYFSFLILCIPITQFLVNYVVLKIWIKITKNTWKVFYIKNIKNRLYLSLLSCLWFTAFYVFGEIVDYPYNSNIFSTILCILISAIVFLITHIFIRYIALNSYFDIFKMRSRKIKTFITMIELMSDTKKRLFSLPIMNFLIDFPSSDEYEKAKKLHSAGISFKLIKNDEYTAQQIADGIRSRIYENDDYTQNKKKENEQQQAVDEFVADIMESQRVDHKQENDKKEEEAEEEKKEDNTFTAKRNEHLNEMENIWDEAKTKQSLSEWLDEQKLSAAMKNALDSLNITNMEDLESILIELYKTTHRDEFSDKSFNDNIRWMNELKNDMLKQGISYTEWSRFRMKAYNKIEPKLKILLNDEKQQQNGQSNKDDEKIKNHGVNEDDDSPKNQDIDEKHEILNLNYDLYSVNLGANTQSVKLISDQDLNKLTRVLSYLIMIKLNEKKQELFAAEEEKKEEEKKWEEIKNNKSSTNDSSVHRKRSLRSNTMQKFFFNSHFTEEELEELNKYKYADNMKINAKIFVKIFANQQGNHELLKQLGEFAWLKFAPKQKEKNSCDLDVIYLNGHIFNIFKDLLLLKKTIDSYTIIITNLQRMIDVITPLLLLFVYLYIFNFNFQDTLGLYISIVGIIAFFGQSYFSSVFASISFVLALNPFLVGDYIMYEEEVYLVNEISLISCTFKWLKTGALYTFQNKQLSDSSEPIINLSRSEGTKTKYRWYVYFKYNITNKQIELFKKRSKELISKHKKTKNENWDSIKVRSNEFCDTDKTKKKVNIQMRYDRYNSDVYSICFNFFTQAMTELKFQWEPLPININIQTNYT